MPITDALESTNFAIKNGLSSVNLTDCVKKVKTYYEIPDNVTLIFKKTDFDKPFNQKLKSERNKTNPGVFIHINLI